MAAIQTHCTTMLASADYRGRQSYAASYGDSTFIA